MSSSAKSVILHYMNNNQTTKGVFLLNEEDKNLYRSLSAVEDKILQKLLKLFANYLYCKYFCNILILYTHILTEFFLPVCLFMYRPEGDLVEMETCRRNTSNKLLFITDCAICWNKYCIMSAISLTC